MTEDVQRLRLEVEKEPSTHLGSAPGQFAEAGRLSPKGIGLFYSADTLKVAVREIALHSPYNEALIGGFKTHRDLKVLDFSRELTKLPSIFASDQANRRRWTFARFVQHFTRRIGAPVILDGRQLVDYTPTQMVAEYLRFVPKPASTALLGRRISTKRGGTSCCSSAQVPTSRPCRQLRRS